MKKFKKSASADKVDYVRISQGARVEPPGVVRKLQFTQSPTLEAA